MNCINLKHIISIAITVLAHTAYCENPTAEVTKSEPNIGIQLESNSTDQTSTLKSANGSGSDDSGGTFRNLKFDIWTKYSVYSAAAPRYLKFRNLKEAMQIKAILDYDIACGYITDDNSDEWVKTNCIALALVETNSGEKVNVVASVSKINDLDCHLRFTSVLAWGQCGPIQAKTISLKEIPRLENRIRTLFSSIKVIPTQSADAE